MIIEIPPSCGLITHRNCESGGTVITIFPVWSHLDRAHVDDLREAANAFPDALQICEEIQLRNDWLSIARRNIRRSDCVVLVLTANSAVSGYCEWEMSYANSIGRRALIWVPTGTGPATPEWAVTAVKLNELPMNAEEAAALLMGIGVIPS
jgi:hypothetical protein